MLEELKELGVDAGYDAYRIKIIRDSASDFAAINPNPKIPAMLGSIREEAIRTFLNLSQYPPRYLAENSNN